MGTVWEATHEVTGARVALKFLTGGPRREDLRQRFLSEARATHLVSHPNVVAVHDVFALEDGTLVMVLDLLEGETLGERLEREEVLTLETLAELLVPIIAGVRAAHAQSVIHRDLNPNNMLLAQVDGGIRPMVLDFGLAKLVAEDGDGPPLTSTGMSIGTPGYTAPEQGFGEPDIDFRVDTWSLGAVLYRALTGGVAIAGGNMGQYLKSLATESIAPLGELEPDLPPAICAVVDAMLDLKPDKRPDLEKVERLLSTPVEQLEGAATAANVSLSEPAASPSSADGAGLVDVGGPDQPAAGPALGRSLRRWVALAASVAVIGFAAFMLVPDAPSATTPTLAGSSSVHPPTMRAVVQPQPTATVATSADSALPVLAAPSTQVATPRPATPATAAATTGAIAPPSQTPASPASPVPPPPGASPPASPTSAAPSGSLRTPSGLATDDPF